MDDLVDKILEAYKLANNIDPLDTSQDAILKLYISAALQIAKKKSCDWGNWDKYEDIPPAIILGIIQLIGLMQSRDANFGIKSESIGGMSQTFIDLDKISDDDYFKGPYGLFGLFCSQNNKLQFRVAKRGNCGGRK